MAEFTGDAEIESECHVCNGKKRVVIDNVKYSEGILKISGVENGMFICPCCFGEGTITLESEVTIDVEPDDYC